MPARFYFEYGGVELTNSTRLYDRMESAPTADPTAPGCPPCYARVRYRDDWSGLREWLEDAPYTATNAPWYDAARPESAEFLGITVLDVTGLDTLTSTREVFESICDGGTPGSHRDTSRRITFTASLVACTAAGAEFGLQWLACRLREGRYGRGLPLQFFAASPEGSATDPDDLVRTVLDCVLTSAPTPTERLRGYGGAARREGSVYTVSWEMASGLPYRWTQPLTTPVDWLTVTFESLDISWSTACAPGAGACPEPATTLYDPLCPPAVLPVSSSAPSLGCGPGSSGSCVPLCSGTRGVWEYTPSTGGSGCGEALVDLQIVNGTGDELRGVTFAWVECGGDRECETLGQANIGYLPDGATLVLDAVRGKVRAIVGGVEMRAPGIVTGAGGGPWSPPVLDVGTCYELVMTFPPGTSGLTVNAVSRGRDA